MLCIISFLLCIVFTGSHGNTWSFGGEYLQTFKPYGEKGRIPVAQFTGEAGYNLHILSDYSMTFHLYGGISALAGYETVNWGKKTLSDGSTLLDGDNFIYGGALNLQAEFYLSDKMALSANVKGRFTFGSEVQVYHTTYGVGVKFIIE
ncbi:MULTISPECIES: conjugal transfer protein TraO [Bacteroidales]|uniref:conjugal transfer protein TraO n=1 Tax=Bacteroidales TaxID=171549 RepID=UPI00259051E8|nr:MULTISPECIES: conjugal transfer protein TraO [Bacteroidales]